MASRSLAEGIADQLSALRAELVRCCRLASKAQSGREIYHRSRQKRRIEAQIDELEARRLDELGGGGK